MRELSFMISARRGPELVPERVNASYVGESSPIAINTNTHTDTNTNKYKYKHSLDTIHTHANTEINTFSHTNTKTNTNTNVELQDQWNGPYFFFLISIAQPPVNKTAPIFFSRGVFPSYYHVISDFCHIWGPFMAKI